MDIKINTDRITNLMTRKGSDPQKLDLLLEAQLLSKGENYSLNDIKSYNNTYFLKYRLIMHDSSCNA